MNRAIMWLLIVVVAAAAAVLSFSALRDLAVLCGFSSKLAWLLPITVDAGAAAGSLGWLGGHTPPPARRFARTLALVLLGLSVAANALGHGLAAYGARPHWLVVVAVSAVAPAVLGAVVHLAVLTTPSGTASPEQAGDGPEEGTEGEGTPPDWWGAAPYAATAEGRAAELIDSGAGRRRLASELGVSEHQARQMIEARNGASR